MTDNKPVYIISDSPEKESVEFGFNAYARTIADLIANKENKTPLVIGIYGPWGSGKTTLMETVKRLLKDNDYSDTNKYRKCKTVWFQAWKYGNEDEILAALIEQIFKSMKEDDFFEKCKAEIKKLSKKLKKSKVIGDLSKLLTGIDITEYFDELKYKEKLGSYDTFQGFFDDLLWTYLTWHAGIGRSEQPNDKNGALVVFIDDLDRCPKERIIKVLETIKLFMDKEGCVFVIGAADETIVKELKKTYGDNDARNFLDKIVQLTFTLPRIPDGDFKPYLEKIAPASKEKIEPFLNDIVHTIQSNPRRFKRFLNDLCLTEGIHKNKSTGVIFDDLLRIKLIEFEAPEIRIETPGTIRLLMQKVDELSEKNSDTGTWEISAEKIKSVPAISLHPYLENRKLTNLIRHVDLDEKQIEEIVSISDAIRSTAALPEEEDRRMQHKMARQAKSELDTMTKVDAGKFRYGTGKDWVEVEDPFEIDVYPVTNRQFEDFVHAGGYKNDDYWTEQGKKWRDEKNITVPRYRDDEKWNQPEHPVVGVSFYEADAYAKWAGKELPTKEQWERAARGTDGRKYPWEGGFDKEKCNTSESGIGKTTRVTRYPNGISPDGCYDMAGNVWEWTDSWYDKDQGTKVLRGGSWNNSQGYARCAARLRGNPDIGDITLGFRCIRTKK